MQIDISFVPCMELEVVLNGCHWKLEMPGILTYRKLNALYLRPE
jgi:hypothetical protein